MLEVVLGDGGVADDQTRGSAALAVSAHRETVETDPGSAGGGDYVRFDRCIGEWNEEVQPCRASEDLELRSARRKRPSQSVAAASIAKAIPADAATNAPPATGPTSLMAIGRTN